MAGAAAAISTLRESKMPTDREIDKAVDRYIARLEAGDVLGAVRAQEEAETLIAQKQFEDDGV